MFDLDARIDHICACTCARTIIECISRATRPRAGDTRYAPRCIGLRDERRRVVDKIFFDILDLCTV